MTSLISTGDKELDTQNFIGQHTIQSDCPDRVSDTA